MTDERAAVLAAVAVRIDALQRPAIVDGVFLLRADLADIWSLSVFLDVDQTVALERAIARDTPRFGGKAAARLRYASRYIPGETLYLEDADPAAHADVVIDNTAPDQPSCSVRHRAKP